jgi:hypothetical protein
MRGFAGRARANTRATWEIVKNFFSIEVLVANNDVAGKYADEIHASHFETATGITAAFQVTKKLEAFAEWDAIYQMDGADRGPRHYAVGGLVYFISPTSHPTSQSTAAWEWL